ncbi:MAG: ADP-ribosylglycohydrolase family protein [Clostridiales bacterium]|nr:ADP-ribosylglycohydrolase family protein [Clostridiales bacterium]
MLAITLNDYRRRVAGCFTGKCVGGTLGMKYEGHKEVKDEITYYDPIPDAMLPNDDLDLQITNLESVLRCGLPITRCQLREMWLNNLTTTGPDEYGVSRSNHVLHINPPLSGIYRNRFTDGMGGCIRSELWACIAPGNPALAAAFAREDSCTDHSGDGVYAAMFLAALESQAFVESNLRRLVDCALGFVPEGNRLHAAFADTVALWDETGDIPAVRAMVIERHAVSNFTDVVANLCFILLSLLSCEGSFDRAICTAVKLGYDTDCTAATVGAVFGIMNPDGIDPKWTDPIGDEIVMTRSIVNVHNLSTIGDFCDKVSALGMEVQDFYNTGIDVGGSAPEGIKLRSALMLSKPWTSNKNIGLLTDWQDGALESVMAALPLFTVLEYPAGVDAVPGNWDVYKLRLLNILDLPVTVCADFSAPDGWDVKVFPEVSDGIVIKPGEKAWIPFTVTVKDKAHRCPLNLITARLTVNGLPFHIDMNIRVSIPWKVTDGEGKSTMVETSGCFFTVPAGRYTCETVYNANLRKKEIRYTCAATRPFAVYLDDELLIERDGSLYVPALHRGGSMVIKGTKNGPIRMRVEFPEGGEGEFFFMMGDNFGCGPWINDTVFLPDMI